VTESNIGVGSRRGDVRLLARLAGGDGCWGRRLSNGQSRKLNCERNEPKVVSAGLPWGAPLSLGAGARGVQPKLKREWGPRCMEIFLRQPRREMASRDEQSYEVNRMICCCCWLPESSLLLLKSLYHFWLGSHTQKLIRRVQCKAPLLFYCFTVAAAVSKQRRRPSKDLRTAHRQTHTYIYIRSLTLRPIAHTARQTLCVC
jgi:hypothetical protein